MNNYIVITNTICIPGYRFVFLKVNNYLFFLFVFSQSSMFLSLIFSSICPTEVSSVQSNTSGHQPPIQFSAIPSGTLCLSSFLICSDCSPGLLHRCHPRTMCYQYLGHSLPLCPGFFCFLDPGSSSLTVYFCFDGESPPVTPSFIYFMVLMEHFLQQLPEKGISFEIPC